jgi:hypothetical protein
VQRARSRFAIGAAAVLLAVLGVPPASSAPAGELDQVAGGPVGSTGSVPSDLASRYLAARPPLGPVTVIDLAGESADRILLATTLQGSVNRTTARLYLVGARPRQEDQRWLDDYQARGLISVTATVGLDEALATFAGELGGYILADAAEPWTINTATTVAGTERGVVATPATRAAAEAAGLPELDDHRGRWTTAADAYEAIAARHRADLRLPTVALQQPDRHAPRDLYVQQGLLVAYTRPPQPDFDRVYDLLETFPSEHPVYGYVSDTGEEEVTAVARLSFDGRYLIPTDTASNLSFHLAVGDATRSLPRARGAAPVEECRAEDVNVVLALSDGDNLTIPLAYSPRPQNWASPRRGELPIGWGITPATAVLAPAVWDRYLDEASPADEIVDIMGLGYSYGSIMPNATTHQLDGARLRAALGIRSHWSLDALLSDPAASGWGAIGDAWDGAGPPAGVLLNYGRWPGPAWFRTEDGVPVLASRAGSYDDGPTELAELLRDLQALAPSDRPLVNFYSVTVWTTTYEELAEAMAPLQADGVRFLTPSEAFACLPVGGSAPSTTATTSVPTTSGPTSPPGPAVPVPASPLERGPSYVG